MRIIKICEFCKNEFIAKKRNSKTCSDACAKRLYKLNQRNGKIAQAEVKAEIKRSQNALITEDEIKAMQAKENLTLSEAAFVLNISPLTLRRWILSGKMNSFKVGKKHSIRKRDLLCGSAMWTRIVF